MLIGSVVGKYIFAPLDVASDGEINSVKSIAAAFKGETSIALDMFDKSTVRRGSTKLFIIRMLLFVGASPVGNKIAVVARLIEVLSLRPELSLNYIIEDFARTHSTDIATVTRTVEKAFNIYDPDFIERVTYLTGSEPLTAKDVLVDLSVYVRLKQQNTEFFDA